MDYYKELQTAWNFVAYKEGTKPAAKNSFSKLEKFPTAKLSSADKAIWEENLSLLHAFLNHGKAEDSGEYSAKKFDDVWYAMSAIIDHKHPPKVASGFSNSWIGRIFSKIFGK